MTHHIVPFGAVWMSSNYSTCAWRPLPRVCIFKRCFGGLASCPPRTVLYLFCLCLKQEPQPRTHPRAGTFPEMGGSGLLCSPSWSLCPQWQILLSPSAIQLQVFYLIGTSPKWDRTLPNFWDGATVSQLLLALKMSINYLSLPGILPPSSCPSRHEYNC